MKWLLIVRPEAEHDLTAARDWYDGVQTGLGDAFLDEIAATLHPPRSPRLRVTNSETAEAITSREGSDSRGDAEFAERERYDGGE
ncbi:MAG TPA: hypothetical protein VL357_10715 [Rariglobus sp.]|jgi:hypothetical protein|nr:hypothetical protein [Rariglobus sp.]